jgi:hypothetical protein
MAIIADFARSVAVATPLFSATVPLYTAAVAMGRAERTPRPCTPWPNE